jgi:hypothetical protein
MRFPAGRFGLLLATLLAASVTPLQAASAAVPYCPNPAHTAPRKVPANLVDALMRTFQIDNAAVHDGAVVRCVGSKLMGCYVGANLSCYKAEKSRSLPGATTWCRQNPGSKIIPMAATGHDTIYEWSCRGRRAIAGNEFLTVDPQGYIANNWKEIH